jgi:hypothetical protein
MVASKQRRNFCTRIKEQTVFIVLLEKGRLDLSMENLILEEKWSSLFRDEEIGIAKRRLGRG